jgi:hypothetical protein
MSDLQVQEHSRYNISPSLRSLPLYNPIVKHPRQSLQETHNLPQPGREKLKIPLRPKPFA